MCGIAGMKKMGNAPICKAQINTLLVNIEHRGGDATGVAVKIGDEIYVHKSPDIANKYITTKDYNDFADKYFPHADTILCHTRAWTKGSPKVNNNNHPMFAGISAIVHNGGIRNDDELFREMKLARAAETDSDVIRAIIDEFGINRKAINKLQKMRGTAAIAAISKKDPGKLLLARSGSPLILGSTEEYLFWGSTKMAIQQAAMVWKRRWGVYFKGQKDNLAYQPLALETALIIDDAQKDDWNNPNFEPWHDQFSIGTGPYMKPNYDVYNKYPIRQRQLASETAKTIMKPVHNPIVTPIVHSGPVEGYELYKCRKADCKCTVKVLPKMIAKHGLDGLRCPDCKTTLVPPKTN